MPDDLEQLRREVANLRSVVESLQEDVRRIRSALGTVCFGIDGSWHMKRPKLESVDLDTLDTFYMPAAFCLDLSRKMDYVYLALREFAEEAKRDQAERIARDYDEMYDPRASWEKAAHDTEAVFMRVLEDVFDDHQRLLRRFRP
jgi:hypothetical protein